MREKNKIAERERIGADIAHMNLIELLLALLICLIVGALAHWILPGRGWGVGAILAFALMLVLLTGMLRNLFSSQQSGRPKRGKD